MVGSTYDGSAGGQSTPAQPWCTVPGVRPRSTTNPKGRTPHMNTLIAATDPSQNVFKTIIDAYIPIGQYKLYWLELIGVSIGVASAYLGMKRLVWAWPVGIVANILLFFVYTGALFGADQRIPLFGQAGRQIFFIVTSIYGWWRWSQVRRLNHAGDASGVAITPRWATSRERVGV